MSLFSKVSIAAAMALLASAGSALAQAPAARSQYPDLTTGEAVYKGICQGCHMPDAKGAAGAGIYPALAQNPRLGAAAYPIMIVVRGKKAMPEFGSGLTDDQIAGVVTYIRTNFGNAFAGPVTAAQVTPLRPAR